MPHVRDVLALLEQFVPDPQRAAQDSCRRTMGLLRTTGAPFDRHHFDPGHLTASAVVLSPAPDDILIQWHERLGRWLQPGGHFELEDADAPAAARRETLEETGVDLTGVPWRLVGVDVHRIPAARGEPGHWHHDLVFGFRLPLAVDLGSGEARAEWCPIASLPLRGADNALRRAAARARMELAFAM